MYGANTSATLKQQRPWTPAFRPHLVTDARMQLAAVFVDFPIQTPAVRDSEAGHLEAFLSVMVYFRRFHAFLLVMV